VAKRSDQSPISRRKVLKTAAGLAGVSVLSNCTSVDRVFFGNSSEDNERVVILGGGLAGLTAAVELKKKRIPFRIFEAGSRWGGRLYQAPDLVRAQSVSELGGEWIGSEDKSLLTLCREHRVDVVDNLDLSKQRWLRRGQNLVPLESFVKDLGRLRNLAPDPLSKDISLIDWWKSFDVDPSRLALLEAWSLQYFGVSADRVWAPLFWSRWTSALAPWTERRLRLRGGSQNLVNTLRDTISSFRSAEILQLDQKLRAVKIRDDGFILQFSSAAAPEQRVSVFAKRVICTIPLAVLGEIDGISDLLPGFSSATSLQSPVGQHGKMLVGFNDRFWLKTMEQGMLYDFARGQSLWESSFRANPLFQFRQGVLSLLISGPASQNLGPQTLDQFRKDLAALCKTTSEPQILDSVQTNWSQMKNFKGSVSYLPFEKEKRVEWTAPSGWAWAGEHTAGLKVATLEGAVLSAKAAVEKLSVTDVPSLTNTTL
jgi:monoamine oxidase